MSLESMIAKLELIDGVALVKAHTGNETYFHITLKENTDRTRTEILEEAKETLHLKFFGPDETVETNSEVYEDAINLYI